MAFADDAMHPTQQMKVELLRSKREHALASLGFHLDGL